MKVIDIIKNDPITGVQYGLVEVSEDVKIISHNAAPVIRQQQQIKKHFIRTNRTRNK